MNLEDISQEALLLNKAWAKSEQVFYQIHHIVEDIRESIHDIQQVVADPDDRGAVVIPAHLWNRLLHTAQMHTYGGRP